MKYDVTEYNPSIKRHTDVEVINLNNSSAVKVDNATYIIRRKFGKLQIKDLIKNKVVKTGNKL